MLYPEQMRGKVRSAMVALLLAAVTLAPRVAMLLTVERAPDADESVVGLMAKHISELKGIPLYFYGQHYGGGHVIEAILSAIGFFVTGPSAFVVQLVPALFSVGIVLLAYGFLSGLHGRRTGFACALVLAFSTPFLKSSLKADGYIETIFLCFGAVYLMQRLLDSLPGTGPDGKPTGNEWLSLRYSILMAFCLGLAWWSYDFSLLTTAAIGVALIARRGIRSFAHLIILAICFAAGAGLLLYDNIANDFANLRHLLGGSPGGSSLPLHFIASVERLFTIQLPAFLTRECVHNFAYPPPREAWAYYGLLLFCILVAAKRRGDGKTPLIWALAPALYIVFYCISAFSGVPRAELPPELNRPPMIYGVSPRYLLPLEPYLSLFIATGVALLLKSKSSAARYTGVLAALAVAAVLTLGTVSIFRDDSVMEGEVKTDPDSIPRVVRFLEKRDIDCVNTTYFIKWRILFESREKINAVDMLITSGDKDSEFTKYEDSGCTEKDPPVYVLNVGSPYLQDVAMLLKARREDHYAVWQTKDHVVFFPVKEKRK